MTAGGGVDPAAGDHAGVVGQGDGQLALGARVERGGALAAISACRCGRAGASEPVEGRRVEAVDRDGDHRRPRHRRRTGAVRRSGARLRRRGRVGEARAAGQEGDGGARGARTRRMGSPRPRRERCDRVDAGTLRAFGHVQRPSLRRVPTIVTADAPIGIFDSGFGGLTVARSVIDQLPHESVRLPRRHRPPALRPQADRRGPRVRPRVPRPPRRRRASRRWSSPATPPARRCCATPASATTYPSSR